MATPPRGALLQGDVASTLRSMTLTSAVGMVAMIATSLVDTYWVSRLGTAPLAAVSMFFPLDSLVMNVGLGLMIGTSTAVARAQGAGDPRAAARLTTHAVVLAAAVFVLLVTVGYLVHVPLFRALGADASVLPLLTDYLRVWCVGIVFMVVPLLVNGALRAVGDATTPMRVMILGALLTAVLDPLFIFGAGPVPALGLRGAAVASLCARVVVCGVVLVVSFRRGLLDVTRPSRADILASARTILRVGGPAVVTNALGPVAITLVTALVASHGAAALAAYGTGARIDALAMIAPFALSGVLGPFVGQNWGAHLRKRVSVGVRGSILFVVAWGVAGAAVLLVAAPWIASAASTDPDVRAALVVYLRTMPIGYAFLATVGVASAVFNAVDEAMRSTLLSVLRSLVIAVPAAWLGGRLGGLPGMYTGLVAASMVAAILGVYWLRGHLHPNGEVSPRLGKRLTLDEAVAALKPAVAPAAREALAPVVALEDVQLLRVRGGLVGIFVGARELAHLHEDGRVDLPLPVEIGDNLLRFDIVHPHGTHPDDGWYAHTVQPGGAESTTWLLRLAHVLYEMSQRGAGDPVTQAELDAFTHTDRCVEAMTAAASRWGLRMEQPSRALA